MNDKTCSDTKSVESISFKLKHLSLSALTRGKSSHEVVLCLHGYLDNAASFMPILEEVNLLADRYLVAVDFPGHGFSGHRSGDAHYHFLDYVSDLAELFKINNWQSIDIVAHSMGAMVASAFAAAFPEHVKSLTLIDALGFISSPTEQTTKQLRKGVESRLGSSQLNRTFTQESAIKARMYVSDLDSYCAQTIIERSLVVVPPENDALVKTSEKSSTPNILYKWRSDPRLRSVSPYRFTLEQGQQLYKDIKCPVQLIYGEQGMMMVKTGIKHYAPYLNNLTVNKLTGGHHVHMEQPKLLLMLVTKFYEDIKASGN